MLATQIQMLRELRITKALKKNVECDINKLMPANLYLTKKKNLSAENRNSEWFLIQGRILWQCVQNQASHVKAVTDSV